MSEDTGSDVPQAIGPYSLFVKRDGFVFCSGQIPLDPATGKLVGGVEAGGAHDVIREQTTQVLKNIRAVLGQAGCEPADVVKTTVFLTDMADFAEMNELYAGFFGDVRPARSTVAVAGLPAGARIEIEVIACRRRS